MVSTVTGSPRAARPSANPLTHIISGFSAVSAGRFADLSAGSSSTHSTSTQSPAWACCVSVMRFSVYLVGARKRGSGMSTTVSMPGLASFMSGM